MTAVRWRSHGRTSRVHWGSGGGVSYPEDSGQKAEAAGPAGTWRLGSLGMDVSDRSCRGTGHWQQAGRPHEIFRRFPFRKSIMMYCPRVSVLVK
jgi:hypothetical protein